MSRVQAVSNQNNQSAEWSVRCNQISSWSSGSWERDVDPRECARFFLRAEFLRARFDCDGDGCSNIVEQFADDWLLFLRERFHLLAPGGNAAAASEIFHSCGLERLLVVGVVYFSQCGRSKIFKWMRHE